MYINLLHGAIAVGCWTCLRWHVSYLLPDCCCVS